METPEIANQSPDHVQLRAGDQSHQQAVKVEAPRDSKWMIGLLGASIVVNLWCGMHIFWNSQEQRLVQEHLAEDTQETGAKIAALEAQVKVLQNQGPLTIIVKREISK